ncbi:MAG TPA: carboxylesterase family protein, partial [Chitinophagales bacterium]|nr:carboxylesterase family protein [Chitinophagales bacterium]
MQKIILHFLLLFAFVSQLRAQCDGRYTTATFTASKKADILYGGNYDSNGKWTDLVLDVYEPAEDTASLRPLIIFVHGGSFVGGSRTDQRIDLTARHFAEKGYVTANIEYRVEQTVAISPFLNFASPDNWYKAMIRASHDLRAAIRYFKKDA